MNHPDRPFRQVYLSMLTAGLVVGFPTGWYVGRNVAGQHPASIGKSGGHDTKTAQDRRMSAFDKEPSAPGSGSALKLKPGEVAKSVRSIFRETVPERRMAMFESLLERVGVEQYPVVVSLIRENDLRGSDSGDEWTSLWSNWGIRDPQGAFEFIKKQDWTGWDPLALDQAKIRAITTWAETDPEQARRFLEGGGEFSSHDRTLTSGLVEGWAAVDPHAAAEWLFKNGQGGNREYKAVVESISRKGGHEALDAWFSGLGTAPERDKAGVAEVIARVKQEHEPEKAAAWIEQHLNEPWMVESGIVDSLARSYASGNPKEAMEWAGKNGLQSAALSAMGIWCQNDLPAARDWYVENAQNPAYQATASVLMQFLNRDNPASAKTWAEGLTDQKLRSQILDQLQRMQEH